MADYVVAQASVLIVPSLKKFNADLQRQLKASQRLVSPVTVDVEANTKKFVAEAQAAKKALEKDPVNVKFRVVDATKQITEIRYKYEDLVRETKKGLILNLKIVGLSLLPQLAQGLAAANASIVQLTQSALVLPGVLSSVLSSVGALATGLGGVKDAFKEYGEAQKNAAQESLKARNSAKNIQNAYRDLGRAIKDSKRQLEDLNAELRGAPLDEADALIRIAEARAEAADKFEKSGLQQQKDLLALRRAENELVEVRMRNSRLIEDVAAANAKGVAGSDAVTEATERLSKAQDEAATQATKLSDSLKELSPNAQAFVTTVTGMSDQWNAFKNTVQENLFAGLDQEVTRFAQTSLPTLERGFGAIATALNDNVKSAMRALESPTNQGFLDSIFADTAKAQTNLSKAFDPLIDGFLRLSEVGASFMPRIMDGFADLTKRFDNFVIRASSDGSLEKWIEQGIDEFNALGNTIINLGAALNSLTEAFTGSGGRTFLEALESGTEKLADFLDSAEGQEKLKTFFIEAREEFDKWGPLLSALPGLIANLSDAGQAWADVLLPFLAGTSRLLADNQILVDALLYAFIAWKGVYPILKGLYSGIGLVNKAVGLFATQFDNAGNKTTGFKTKVGALSAALGSTGGLVTAATLAATWIGTNLAKAHADAAAAAQRQKDDLDALKRSLDEVTGSATNASRALVADNIMQGVNEATGERFGDVFEGVAPADAQTAIDRIVAGDRVGALEAVGGGATAQEIEKTPFWESFGASLNDAGLNSATVAQALNGDPAALPKFEAWVKEISSIPGIPDSLLRGLNSAGIVNSPNASLKDLLDQLPQDVQRKAARAGEINSAVTGLETGKANTQTQNQRAFGSYSLKPGSPFESLGIIEGPAVGQDGGGLVTRSAPADGSPLADQLRNDGVTFRADGPDRFIVRLTQDAINKYFTKMASGGLVSGPGTGTSDSILTALSSGEYVINARSTAKHFPLLEQINRGAPGLAGGGMPLSPSPKPPNLDDMIAPKSQMTEGARFGGWGASKPLQTSGNFGPNKSAIQRIGDTPVGNFFKSALGIGAPPPGYGETRTARVESDFTFYGGQKSAPPSKPAIDTSAYDGVVSGPVLSDMASNVGLTPKPAAPAPKPVPKSGTSSAPSKPSAPAASAPSGMSASTNPRVNPQTTVHGSSGVPVYPGPTLPPPLAAESPVGAIAQGTGLPTGAVASAVPPEILKIPGGTQLALEAYGLAAQTNIPYGGGGFPDWVYGLGGPFGMLASTYPGHQTGSGYNRGIDWAPKEFAWNTPEGAAKMTQFAKYLASTGMMEQIIYQNPFTGETVGVADGKLVGPGTDQPQYYANDWAGHQNHIHTRTSKRIPNPSELRALGLNTSPSNTPMATTPTGVMLPQLSFAPNSSGVPSGMSASSGSGAANGGGMGGLRLPTPEEYMQRVTESWLEILDNLARNAGQIALQFLGSFIGIDLGGLANIGGRVGSGLDLFSDDDGGGDAASQLGAIPAVDDLLNTQMFQSLPPEYQQAYVENAPADPQKAVALLQELAGIAGGGGTGSVKYDPSKGAEQWRPVVRQILSQVAPQYGITNLKAWEDDIIGQINLESRGDPGAYNGSDTDGKGGTQQVYGLGQFLPATFNAHNKSGGDINDPVAQIYAMIDYLASPKYGVIPGGGVNWKGVGWRNGKGYATGGLVRKGGPADWEEWTNDGHYDYLATEFGQEPDYISGFKDGGWFDRDPDLPNPDNFSPEAYNPMPYFQYSYPNQSALRNAAGGPISGRGNGKSDSILARVSNGEYIVRAPMAQKHLGLLNAINSNALPGFAEGMMWPQNQPAPVTPPPVTTPPPPPSPAPPPPGGPAADAAAGQPTAPSPVTNNMGAGDEESTALADIGAALGGIGSSMSGAAGAEAPAGESPTGDPRSALGAAPQNLDHNKPAVSQGITAAAGAIGSAVSTAMSVAAGAGTMGAGGGAGAAASAPVQALIQAGGQAVVGAVNILSSLGVGTLTRNSTAGAYGSPLTPKGVGQEPYSGPSVVNNWNGGVHTSNNEEFYKLQQRRELQNAAPYLPQR